MKTTSAVRSFLWTLPAALLCVAVVVIALRSHTTEVNSDQVASRAQLVDLTERVRVALATASDAERSAVLAITDQESQSFANQSRAATAEVDRLRAELTGLLAAGDHPTERESLDRFAKSFEEFRTLDAEILALAVKNTNLKAYGIAFGTAAQAVDEINKSLSHLVDKSTTPRDAALSAARAQIAVLHLQTLLAPHIAAESEPKMRALETLMDEDDKAVRTHIDALASVPSLHGDPDLSAARASYSRFADLRAQILALSHENTNVRSLSLTLDGNRSRVMTACQDALADLRQALIAEPSSPVIPLNPRHIR